MKKLICLLFLCVVASTSLALPSAYDEVFARSLPTELQARYIERCRQVDAQFAATLARLESECLSALRSAAEETEQMRAVAAQAQAAVTNEVSVNQSQADIAARHRREAAEINPRFRRP